MTTSTCVVGEHIESCSTKWTYLKVLLNREIPSKLNNNNESSTINPLSLSLFLYEWMIIDDGYIIGREAKERKQNQIISLTRSPPNFQSTP